MGSGEARLVLHRQGHGVHGRGCTSVRSAGDGPARLRPVADPAPCRRRQLRRREVLRADLRPAGLLLHLLRRLPDDNDDDNAGGALRQSGRRIEGEARLLLHLLPGRVCVDRSVTADYRFPGTGGAGGAGGRRILAGLVPDCDVELELGRQPGRGRQGEDGGVLRPLAPHGELAHVREGLLLPRGGPRVRGVADEHALRGRPPERGEEGVVLRARARRLRRARPGGRPGRGEERSGHPGGRAPGRRDGGAGPRVRDGPEGRVVLRGEGVVLRAQEDRLCGRRARGAAW
mmetsp:Transcript_6173/g.18199  ORF Transcript_6173/g.18199 Transcript_6173/m.18199 type:complete len:288 (-) Transcript_6173:507-1370(-)